MNTRTILPALLAALLLCCASSFCPAEEEPRQIILPKDITTANLKFNNSGAAPQDKAALPDKPQPAVYKSSATVTKVTYIFVNKDADKKTPARWNTPDKKGSTGKASAKKGPVVKTVVKKLQISKSKYAAVSLDSLQKNSGDSKLKKPNSSSGLADKIAGGGDEGVQVGGK